MTDTIFALSSGALPAAIGVIRISGPQAGPALFGLAGRLPEPRRASFARLRDADGDELDSALVLWLPGPTTETGEDVVELQCHGARAVVAAVEARLAQLPGLRKAGPGEFTRRAFRNGKLDLAQVEGLGDLLEAETELQRRAALGMAGGAFSRLVERWRQALLMLAAEVEAVLDFADEGDVPGLSATFAARLGDLRAELAQWLSQPRAEALREGFRVVIAGPPNSGKSKLFNTLVEDEAAISSPIAGTTRDVLTRPVAIGGVPFLFVDTAGLRDQPGDSIEEIGIDRARGEVERADLVLWLGAEADLPVGAWNIAPQIDRVDPPTKSNPRHQVSALTGEGLDALRADLLATARGVLPKPGTVALNRRQHGLLEEAAAAVATAGALADPLLVAEELRRARLAFDQMVGRSGTEDLLDTLFCRFCIGK
jgi:tRNA modification GTPase